MEFYHAPVMVGVCLAQLNLKDGGVYVDATLGGGGHTEAMLKSNSTITVYGFDQDSAAIAHASKRLEEFSDRVHFIHSNFARLRTQLALQRITKVDGILFDLGVSSRQIDDPTRGFSFMQDGKLDMRMDATTSETAYDFINTASVEELTRVFREYGEEREAYHIARAIATSRAVKPIETTYQLSEIIDLSARSQHKIKVKARIFQAIRIHLNGELDVLKSALSQSIQALAPQGRLVVMSYHSLEDRIVKQFMVEEAKDCVCPPSFPVCQCSKISTIKILTRKPIGADASEIEANPRARSAKLRVAERKEEK
ncbi:MAG: 16S rRNA (cytosine(1402)-N(4))-methyltransferase RsmH [Candidatus Cloacimonetes bacterium]|nr:16S rRNA (cytosine(1402)-N(4))-methyltransferase RsmH [Candidatus Cloacimonadota bacterium]